MRQTLNVDGKVLHKEFIGKMPNREPSRVTILSLPTPQEVAVVIGMFDDRFGWSMLRVDAAGKIAKTAKLINEPSAFLSAVLLPDKSGVLLAGQRSFKGNVWKVDLDGKTAWKRTYERNMPQVDDKKEKMSDPRAKAPERSSSQFWGITLTDDHGGFIVAGDCGQINKFGMGQRTSWLARCDAAGTVLSEVTFPGRFPTICAIGNGQYAVLYDAGAAFESDARIRVVDRELKPQWEKKADFAAMVNGRPVIGCIPSGRGFVLAGANVTVDTEKKSMKQECRFFQYDSDGQIVSSASVPITEKAFLHTRVACEADRAYVAVQTKGLGPFDAKEAGVFGIPLKTRK